LNGLFEHKETGDVIMFEEYDVRNFEGVTFPVSEVKSGRHSVLIIFTQKGYMTCRTIAHEAVHAAGMICKSINQRVRSEEYFAYLTGWIADCCWEYKNGKKEPEQVG
jgi:hypothetical protein